MSDLSQIPNDQEAFKARVSQVYPNIKPGAVPNFAGQLRRFTYEMKAGDLVVYPSKQDRQIHIGRVTGDYQYNPGLNAEYPHMRRATWLKAVSRLKFSQGALYEVGSAMTFFQVKNYADEYAAALGSGQSAPVVPAIEDETVPQVTAAVEENTEDYILKRLAQDLKGHPLAHFVAHLLGTMGYRTRISPPGPDGGVDIIAHRDELGFEPPIIKVQVKSSESNNVGDPEVSSLYGKLGASEYGLFVTLGGFTTNARNFAKGKSNLRLIDGGDLIALILEHYEQFDSRYKGLIPLKRVYVPEPTTAEA
jgi:restriction system protein